MKLREELEFPPVTHFMRVRAKRADDLAREPISSVSRREVSMSRYMLENMPSISNDFQQIHCCSSRQSTALLGYFEHI
jgi:hypothetical protein